MLWDIGDTRRFTDPEACNEASPTVVVIGNETRCEAPGCGTEIEQPEEGAPSAVLLRQMPGPTPPQSESVGGVRHHPRVCDRRQRGHGSRRHA